jgi:hypothetical protein
MMTNITYGTFIFFGSSLIVGIVAVVLFMPETKGLSLEEMDILFGLSGLAHGKRVKADEVIRDMRAAEDLVGTPDVDGKDVVVEHSEK